MKRAKSKRSKTKKQRRRAVSLLVVMDNAAELKKLPQKQRHAAYVRFQEIQALVKAHNMLLRFKDAAKALESVIDARIAELNRGL